MVNDVAVGVQASTSILGRKATHRLLSMRLHPDEAACALRVVQAGLATLSDAPAP